MRKIWLLVCAMVLAYFVQGQSILEKRDSLRTLLQQNEHDTLRALQLAELSLTYLDFAPDSQLVIATQALNVSRKNNFKRGEALSLLHQGGAFSSMGNRAKGLEKILEALRLGEKINNPELIRACLNGIGVIYKREGDGAQALLYFFKAKNIAERHVQHTLPISLVNIGATYADLQKYDSAKLYVQQGYDKATAQKNQRIVGLAMVIMGEINLKEGRPALALEYYRLVNRYTLDASAPLVRVSLGMAKAFVQTDQLDSSLLYARQALAIANANKFLADIPVAGTFIYEHYKRTRNSDSALFYLELTRMTQDSLNSRENRMKMQALSMEETLRQQEKQQEEEKANEQRRHNLQYAAIGFGLVTLFIGFLILSHSVVANQRLIKFLGVVSLLIVFEFLNLLLHPWLGAVTHHSPVLMLLAMVCVAGLLVPLHHRIEHWTIQKLVEKNNRIRLAAARKTIAKLETIENGVPVEKSTNAQQEL